MFSRGWFDIIKYHCFSREETVALRKKNAPSPQSVLRINVLCLLLFACGTAFYNFYLAGAEFVIAILLYLLAQREEDRRKRAVLKYVESVPNNLDVAARDTMTNAPLPMVIFRPESDEVVWTNDRFLQLLGAQEAIFNTSLSDLVPEFETRWLMEGKSECPTEVCLDTRRFLVFGNLVRAEEHGRVGYLATTYWVDVTDLSITREEHQRTRPVVAILMLDNYDELMKNLPENERSSLRSDIDARLDEWASPVNGLFCRFDRDHYLFLFEEQYLADYIEGKFSVLDTVHKVVSQNGISASLSIGLGRDADSFGELYQYASLSVDMALSRGGDQAVVKNRFNFEFYGGRSKETEKRTKVKSRVMANALSQLISDSSQVFIMGHKDPDMDSCGAAAGICAIARKLGVPAYVVRETAPAPATVMFDKLAKLPEYETRFLAEQDALLVANSRCLLVVVDTNRPEQVQAESLLASCNRVVVIDHHRRAATYIEGAALNYHEPYASSASELVSELLQYIIEPADLLRTEAEALLCGIVLDTKQFTMRTGGRTFEAAAFLRRCGADTSAVKKLFQNDLEGTIARYSIIQNARMYKAGIAIATVDHSVGRVTAGQAADELLNISGIEASFVLFRDGERTVISARSMGDINVQVIVEKLGGGGNAATAGAQLPSTPLEDAASTLLHAIDQYLEGQ